MAVIGTGASAVQFVPEVAARAERLYVFQRTGNWFLPRRNREYPSVVRAAIRYGPGVQALRRRFIYYYAETLTMMIRNPRTVGRVGRARSALFMRWQLRDPEVRRKAWPGYTFGCKRVLFSSHYLPALQRPNVELVVDPIARLVASGVVTGDGALREVDCVIGTGFKTTEFMFPMEVVGAGGRSLREQWAGGAHAHLGVCVPGFPSLFLMYGPNTNTSGGSIVFYEETQAAYIRQALRSFARGGRFDRRRARGRGGERPRGAGAFAGTAWTQCDSWYRDERGRIVANWPGYMTQYAERLRVLDPREYEFAPPLGAPTLGRDDR